MLTTERKPCFARELREKQFMKIVSLAQKLGLKFSTPIFDGSSLDAIDNDLKSKNKGDEYD